MLRAFRLMLPARLTQAATATLWPGPAWVLVAIPIVILALLVLPSATPSEAAGLRAPIEDVLPPIQIDGAFPPEPIDGSGVPGVLLRDGGQAPATECGTISEHCSKWYYAGLCTLGIREIRLCRYCEIDCETGQKKCHREGRQRCKMSV